MGTVDVAIGVDVDCVAGHENAQFVALETVAEKDREDPSVYEGESRYV
ncbi:hypothetical protein [Natronolimnobius sp. AArcel1]|nr:hypothetical protein [Natronolimnobius sp. AArcel1]